MTFTTGSSGIVDGSKTQRSDAAQTGLLFGSLFESTRGFDSNTLPERRSNVSRNRSEKTSDGPTPSSYPCGSTNRSSRRPVPVSMRQSLRSLPYRPLIALQGKAKRFEGIV